MENFLDIIDKYKFGIVAAVTVYLGIFIYIQMPTVKYYYEINPYFLEAEMEIPEDEIQLRPENIQVNMNTLGEVKNAVRDQNDSREQSNKNWSSHKSLSEVEQSVYDLEKQMYEDAGGAAERERIKKEMEARKADQQSKPTTSNKGDANLNGAENAPMGNVLAEWNLKDRIPHLNRSSSIRIPGYMCGVGSSGVITVNIKVGQSGDVISATYDPSRSSSSNACMVQYAEKYALMSRFAYSSKAPKVQEGTITYTYISQ